MSRSRILARGLLLVALALHFFEARHPGEQIDDAYISYRYAENLATGQGLVFNPGERVEGITNLLWTLLLALGEVAGVPAPRAAHALGAASGALLLWLTWLWVRERVDPAREWLAGVAALGVWSSSSFGAWALSGLETPLFAALVIAALLAQARRRLGLATALAVLATLTRPEGALLGAVLYGAELWPLRREPAALLARAGPAACYAAALLGLTAFRLLYFGALLPNTFYAKVGGIPLGQGVLYLTAFAINDGLWLIPPLLAARSARRPAAAPAFALLLTAYVLAIGGDVFAHGRFLLPVLPLLWGSACCAADAALARSRESGWLHMGFLAAAAVWPLYLFAALPAIAAALAALAARLPRVRARLRVAPALSAAAGLAAVALCALVPRSTSIEGLGSPRRLQVRHWNMTTDVSVRAEIARLLAARPAPRLVAHVAIGRFGYWSRLPILDLLGLVDARVARAPESDTSGAREGRRLPGHQRSDPDYVFARAPDFIFIPREGTVERFRLVRAVLDLWDDPRLARDYAWNDSVRAYERRAR